jgi:hypothetical protein
MILEQINNLIQEAYIFSDDTISVDLDKFESGEVNVLFITGLSGAGKTTLGKNLSKKYNCPFIDTDDINSEISKQYPDDKYPSSVRLPIFRDKFIDLLNSNKKLIIGGIGISRIIEKFPEYTDLILKQSFIFLGKSALKGAWDATMREHRRQNDSSPLEFFKWLYKTTQWNFDWFYERESKLKEARCSIKGAKIEKL